MKHRTGNTPTRTDVVSVDAPRGIVPQEPGPQEDPTTTSLTAAAAVSATAHAAPVGDTDWAQTTDELYGTAVFDATGDRSAMPSWDELVRQHADRVYRLAYRLSGNQHDAEDLTQETFIRVFRTVQSYQPGTFEGWLHRITTNLFLDMVRRRARIRMEALPEDYDRVPSPGPTASLRRRRARAGSRRSCWSASRGRTPRRHPAPSARRRAPACVPHWPQIPPNPYR